MKKQTQNLTKYSQECLFLQTGNEKKEVDEGKVVGAEYSDSRTHKITNPRDTPDTKKKKLMYHINKAFISPDKAKAIDSLFKSLGKDEVSDLESTILSNAVSEFKRKQVADIYLEPKIDTKKMSILKSKYESPKVDSVPKSSIPTAQVSLKTHNY